MYTLQLTISGITCDACVKLIAKKISRLTNVQKVSVDQASGVTNIISTVTITPNEVQIALSGTPYSVVN